MNQPQKPERLHQQKINLKGCKSKQIYTVLSDPIVKADCSGNKCHKTKLPVLLMFVSYEVNKSKCFKHKHPEAHARKGDVILNQVNSTMALLHRLCPPQNQMSLRKRGRREHSSRLLHFLRRSQHLRFLLLY